MEVQPQTRLCCNRLCRGRVAALCEVGGALEPDDVVDLLPSEGGAVYALALFGHTHWGELKPLRPLQKFLSIKASDLPTKDLIGTQLHKYSYVHRH